MTGKANRLLVLFFLLAVCAGCGKTKSSPARGSAVRPPTNTSSVTSVPPASAAAPSPAPPSPNPPTVVHFTGEVNRGQRFEKAVAPKMLFRLNPNAEGDSGWRIEIIPETVPPAEDFDCSGSVTPPAHGPNDLFLDHPDGMTAQKAVQWNPHAFSFIANSAECKLAWDLSLLEIYPSNLTDKEKEVEEEKWAKIPVGNGTFKVLESRLGPPSANDEFGAIEWLRFEVELHFPQAHGNQAETQ